MDNINIEDGSSGKFNGGCSRQSSTRWTPTNEQIRILKDLYYNNGVRSPSAEQIQRISARLRQYGKIEGKNVFYWFQNHKARERQKKRFSADLNVPISAPSPSPCMQRERERSAAAINYAPSPSSTAVFTINGQMGNHGYGSMTMEKSFRDCSISSSGSNNINQNNLGWIGSIDHPYTTTTTFFDNNKIYSMDGTLQYQYQYEEAGAHGGGADMETLPLFPMHGEDNINCKQNPNNYNASAAYYSGNNYWYGSAGSSLELSLNSYITRSSD